MAETDFLDRTRISYDAIAVNYAEWIRDELAAKPLDRAALAAFAELVRSSGAPVADVGCGSGRMTAYLAELDVPVFGIDLSPAMVAVARRQCPGLRFEVGSMTALDLPEAGLGGVLAWYSIIHIPDRELPAVFAELHRVLAPNGYLQIAFQVGDDVEHRTEAAGHQVSLDFHQRHPAPVAAMLRQSGFTVRAQLVREPDEDGKYPELTPQCYLLARKPG